MSFSREEELAMGATLVEAEVEVAVEERSGVCVSAVVPATTLVVLVRGAGAGVVSEAGSAIPADGLVERDGRWECRRRAF
jgi:hypothetical protein